MEAGGGLVVVALRVVQIVMPSFIYLFWKNLFRNSDFWKMSLKKYGKNLNLLFKKKCVIKNKFSAVKVQVLHNLLQAVERTVSKAHFKTFLFCCNK